MRGGALVVGGGISGLAAAYDLMCAGVPVTLVERDERLGGKVRTDAVDGFVVEAGPDSFVTHRPAAQQLASELGLADEVISTSGPRLVYLRRNGRMVPLPEHMGLVLPTRLAPFARTRLFTWPQKLRAGMDVVLPRWLGDADVAIGDFLRHRLGVAMVDQLADPLFGGIYGMSVDELSLDAVLPQLRVSEREHRSLLLASLAQGRAARTARKAAGAAGPAPSGSPFRSLRRGMGSLVDAIVTRLQREPTVDLRLGVSVTALETSGAATVGRLSDGSVRTVGAVVVAASGGAAAALIGTEIPAAADLIRSVRHGSTAVVTLGYTADSFPSPLVGHGFLESGPEKAVFSGCTFTSEKWPGRAPSGTVLLRAFLPDRNAALLAWGDTEVFQAVEREIVDVLGASRPPVMRNIARWPHAMPTYSVGHLDRMSGLDAAMRQRPNWVLAGSTYRGVGVPDCIASGRRAASEVTGLLSRSAGPDEQATPPQR